MVVVHFEKSLFCGLVVISHGGPRPKPVNQGRQGNQWPNYDAVAHERGIEKHERGENKE
jgi:hypothetical protein